MVATVVPDRDDWSLVEAEYRLNQMYHIAIEGIEELIIEVLTIDELPLTAGILVAPAIAFAREIDPFWMTELIAHEVEITAIDGSEGDETDHLVEGNAAVDVEILVTDAEVPVHVGIDQSEDDCLVAYKCLIVALYIRDGLLVGTAVGQCPEDVGHVPVFVALLLEGLDPIVRNTHCQAIVEAHTAIFDRTSESWHAAHFLGDGDSVRVNLVDELVGKSEIADCIAILIAVVVVAIAVEVLSEAVVQIEHGCDSIETEAIELVLFEPVLAVAQEEVEHVVACIVEAEAVPCWVLAAVASIEVLVSLSAEVAKAFELVLDSVAVNKIHDHGNAHAMCLVDESLQLLWCAEA